MSRKIQDALAERFSTEGYLEQIGPANLKGHALTGCVVLPAQSSFHLILVELSTFYMRRAHYCMST